MHMSLHSVLSESKDAFVARISNRWWVSILHLVWPEQAGRGRCVESSSQFPGAPSHLQRRHGLSLGVSSPSATHLIRFTKFSSLILCPNIKHPAFVPFYSFSSINVFSNTWTNIYMTLKMTISSFLWCQQHYQQPGFALTEESAGYCCVGGKDNSLEGLNKPGPLGLSAFKGTIPYLNKCLFIFSTFYWITWYQFIWQYWLYNY